MALTKVTADLIDAPLGGGEPADGSITTAKLADNAVTTAKIADGQITTAKIGTGQVSNSNLAGGITFDKIAHQANVSSTFTATVTSPSFVTLASLVLTTYSTNLIAFGFLPATEVTTNGVTGTVANANTTSLIVRVQDLTNGVTLGFFNFLIYNENAGSVQVAFPGASGTSQFVGPGTRTIALQARVVGGSSWPIRNMRFWAKEI